MRSLFFLGLLIPHLVACSGVGTSAEDVERSMAEFRLGATLHQEGNSPGAIERLQSATELDPQNGEAFAYLGYVLLERRATLQAEEHLRKGIELLTEREDAGAALAEARNWLGLALFAQEKYDESIVEFEASARDLLNRQPHYAWGNLCNAQFEKGNLDAAVTACRQAVEIQPQFCVGHFLLGRAYFGQDQFPECEEALTSAVESHPQCNSYQAAYKLRGECRARLENRDGAIEDLERCVELGQDNEDGTACRRLLDGI